MKRDAKNERGQTGRNDPGHGRGHATPDEARDLLGLAK